MLSKVQSSLVFALGLSALLASAPAQANFVTFTASTSPSQRSTDFSQALSVPVFDKTLGTLTSTTISFADSVTASGTITNNSASATNFNISEDVVFALNYNGTQLLSNDLNAAQAYTALAKSTTAAFGMFNPQGNSGPTTITSPSMLSSFTSQSSSPVVTFDFGTTSKTSVSGGGGNANTLITTFADATVTVTYNFTPAAVPEPSSILMMSIGGVLIASAGVARRRAAVRV